MNATGASLSQTKTVLVRDADALIFRPDGDPGDAPRAYALTIDSDVWADMGYPETITVTIEPGDRLN